jgi:hypothetical protein
MHNKYNKNANGRLEGTKFASRGCLYVFMEAGIAMSGTVHHV